MSGLNQRPLLRVPIQEYVFPVTTTWSPERACLAYVFSVGAGGSGGNVGNIVSGSKNGGATGGGAGGAAKSLLQLSPGVTYTATIGAGGTGPTASIVEVDTQNGNDGGITTFAGTGITTLTGNGGKGGRLRTSNANVDLVIAGAIGGTATGGTIFNVTGGSSGLIDNSGQTTSTLNSYATGGGAPGVTGTAFPSGSITNGGKLALTGNYENATGGAGMGGSSGSLDVNVASSTISTSGGSGIASGEDNLNGSYSHYYNPGNTVNVSEIGVTALHLLSPIGLILGHGSGGRGAVSLNSSLTFYGIGFGGGGGRCGGNGVSGSYVSGAGSWGGGGGGFSAGDGSAASTCGAGGNGLVLIQVLEYLT